MLNCISFWKPWKRAVKPTVSQGWEGFTVDEVVCMGIGFRCQFIRKIKKIGVEKPLRFETAVEQVEGAGSDEPLIEHGIGHLEEAGDVCAVHVVARRSVLLGLLEASLVNVDHDLVEALIDFFL